MAVKPKLVMRAELHTLLGVSRERSYQISDSKRFPEPYSYTAILERPLWRLEDIQSWDKKRKE